MHQLKKLVVQALGIVDLATSFFAFLADYDGTDWEEVDDLLLGSDLSENASKPFRTSRVEVRGANGSSAAFERFEPASEASSGALNGDGVPHHPWN